MTSTASKMTKTVIRGLIVVLPFFIIWAYIYFFPMNYIDDEVPNYTWNRDYCRTTHDEPASVLILGDSVMNSGIIPEEMSDNTVNLALGGSSPAENYYVILEYLDHNAPPKAVYIGFADGHMNNASAFYERTLYSRRFSLRDEYAMIADTRLNGDGTISRSGARLELLQYHFGFPTMYVNALCNGGFFMRRADNLARYAETDAGHGRYMASENVISDLTEYDYNDYPVEPYLDIYMHRIIDLCIENGIQVHVIVPPISPTIHFNEKYLSDMYTYYDGLAAEYPDITVDYHPGENELVIEDYADHLHLNQSGAGKLSRLLRDRYSEDFR